MQRFQSEEKANKSGSERVQASKKEGSKAKGQTKGKKLPRNLIKEFKENYFYLWCLFVQYPFIPVLLIVLDKKFKFATA